MCLIGYYTLPSAASASILYAGRYAGGLDTGALRFCVAIVGSVA